MKSLAKRIPFFYGYVIIVVLWVIYFFNVTMVMYGGSVLNAKMIAATGMNPDIVGYATSLWTLMQGLAGPIIGIMISKKGIRTPFVLGSLILVFGSLLIAFFTVNEISYVIYYGFLLGAGVGFGGMLASQSAVNDWFNKRKPLAMALLLSSGGVGGFIAPLLLNSVASSSWINGWILVSALCGVSILLSLVFLINKPADIDEVPDGKHSVIKDHKGNTPSINRDVNKGMPIKEAYRSPSFFGVFAAYATRNALYYAVTGHLVIYLVSSGVNSTAAAFTISIFSISSLISRFGVGLINEAVLKPKYGVVACNLLMGAGVALISLVPVVPAIYIAAGIMGLGLGLGYVDMPLCISRFFGSNNFSMIIGTTSPVIYTIAALGPLLAGILATKTGSYVVVFLALALITVASGLVLMFMKPPVYRSEDRTRAV